MKKYLFLFAASIFIFSCGPNYILDKKVDFENEHWIYADSIAFDFEIANSKKLYSLYLDVEHLTEYSFQNMYIKLHSVFPDGKRTSQQISVNLMDKFGRWKGDCNSDECDFRLPINVETNFEQIGKYTFIIEQFMRKNPLEGIQSIAFRIEDLGK